MADSSQERHDERIRRVQELRRSNAASAHKNKTHYSRKPKHVDKGEDLG